MPAVAPAEQVGVRHVARAVAEEGDGEPGEVAAVLADREQVGEELAGVEVVAQRVDDRDAVVPAAISSRPGLGVGAPDDRRDLAVEHARGVGTAVSLPPSWLLAVEMIERHAAELGDADGERHARAGRRLVEDDRDGLRAGEGLARPSGPS